MTKVLQVLGRSAGGIARHVAEITQALDGRAGIEIDIAGPAGLPIPMPKPIIEIDIPDGPFGHRRSIRDLRSVIDGGYSVVHAHGLRAGIDAAMAAKHDAATVVVTVHNLVKPEVSGRLKALAYKPAERLVVNLADRILAVSRDIADELSANASDDGVMKIEVLHLGVHATRGASRSPASVREELGLSPESPLVVTASRLSEQKAVHVMVDAIARTGATLVVLGQGPSEVGLRARAASLGLSDRVRFLGFRDDVADFIAAADVFCLSSVWEGVPLAIMEAVQLGTAVVATDVGGTGELIEDGVSGRLVPPGDPEVLGAALSETLAAPDRRRIYAAAARKTLNAEFDTSRMLERLGELYAEGGG